MGARRDAGAAAGEMMATACPRCSAPAVERDKCAQCGVVASVYTAALEKMRRAPTPPPMPAAPRVSAPAAPPRVEAPQPPRPASGSAASATAVMTAAPSPAAAVGAGGSRRLTFHSSGGTRFGIYIVNLLLTSVTRGVHGLPAR